MGDHFEELGHYIDSMELDSREDRSDPVKWAKWLQQQIQEMEKQLAELQAECSHGPNIGFNSSYDVKLSCIKCGLYLGYPDRRDLKDFLDK